ncbi:hypothetical protein SPRG_07398 [Saprolegnia parasitica CBS 223.65]|uniref:BZIP domain-containing protein n=1 Tax=Saprolegnia parasitica (strain CBS 223.65) TaxID=695850 RepID=A0A067CAL3_SAPPC|nr:hypothetical protein SPRG_07398 [Saprolegnia parasitica CBS 223.65]KDO27799.1 hypothetical protein SPRG_07398 [Saprolegnia parasitica CBS 223.65]|eukprot:XP_012201574.1 hypothetical protein SPRG_07398 [Saprolegnia parasitica CBS 223.65]
MDPFNNYPNGNQGHPNMNHSRMPHNMQGVPMGMPMMPDLGMGFDGSYMQGAGGYGLPPMQPPPMATALTPMSTTSSQPSAAASSTTSKAKKPSAAASRKRKAPPSDTQSNPDVPDSPSSAAGGAGGAADNEESRKARRREQIAKAARKHRQRQKDELVALREKVKDLKEQIEVLQSSEPSEHDTETGWKQEAEQHAEIRARVDQENEFLRKTLMEQMKFIQRLQDYFTKQPLLNAPSLNKMLTTAPSSSAPSPALMPPPSMPSSFFQLPTVSFRDTLMKVADDAIQAAMSSVQHGEQLFKQPKVANMSYLGVTVQYEMAKDSIQIFLRHVLPNVNYMDASSRVWDLLTSKAFNEEFPFMESYEVLDAIDNDTKYVRALLNLALPNADAHGTGKIKTERLHAVKRRVVANAVYMAARSVTDDPSWPQTPAYIRRNQNLGIVLRECMDDGRRAAEVLWCMKVTLDEHTDSSITANTPDTILRNLFEVTPPFFKSLLDRVQ